MKNSAWRLSQFSFALLCLGCIGDGNNDEFAISGTMEVLAINRTEGSLITHTTQYECNDGNLTTVEDTTFNRYAIKSGKIILWDPEECDAQILNGKSTDIVGTWTGTGLGLNQVIPAEYRPATCPDSLPSGDDPDMFKDLAVTYTVTEKKITFTASGSICMADIMAESFTESGFTVASKSCNEVNLKDPAGQPMKVNASASGGTMKVAINYKGKTCSLEQDIMPGQKPDCQRQQASMDAYMQCVQGWGAVPVIRAFTK